LTKIGQGKISFTNKSPLQDPLIKLLCFKTKESGHVSVVYLAARPEDNDELGRIIHDTFTTIAEQQSFGTDFHDAEMPK
jgi:hypothetical protein